MSIYNICFYEKLKKSYFNDHLIFFFLYIDKYAASLQNHKSGQHSENSLGIRKVLTVRIKKKNYRKVPIFSDTRKLCCNLPKIQTKRQNHRVFCQKDANGKANSEDPEQTAPLGAV